MRLSRRRQQGVIFLALILVLVVAGSAFALGALSNRQTLANQRQEDLTEKLQEVKELLLTYADISYDYYASTPGMLPGLLPCPDVDHDLPDNTGDLYGFSDLDCNPGTDYIGRLPQYIEMPASYPGTTDRFRLDSTYADIDQQFWYAVSPNFLQTTQGLLPLNSMQSGTLSVDDDDDIVAVIIAPGEALDDQNRADNPNDYAQYLDGGNGAGVDFWSYYDANPELFNDTVVSIKRSEVWDSAAAIQLAAEAIHTRVKDYYTLCTYYPRTFRTTTCALNFSVNSNGLAFRNWINAAGNTTTWIKETASGGRNWVASTVLVYTYVTTTSSRMDFKQYGTSECIRYSMTVSGGVSTLSAPSTVSSC